MLGATYVGGVYVDDPPQAAESGLPSQHEIAQTPPWLEQHPDLADTASGDARSITATMMLAHMFEKFAFMRTVYLIKKSRFILLKRERVSPPCRAARGLPRDGARCSR